MTPRQLLALEPERVSNWWDAALSHCDTDALPEADEDPRVETRYVKYVDFDGTRNWVLGSVWFDGKPAFIFQEAGRSRGDHYNMWVVDRDALVELVRYAESVPQHENSSLHHYDDTVAMDEEMGDMLTNFYGCTLEAMRSYERPKR